MSNQEKGHPLDASATGEVSAQPISSEQASTQEALTQPSNEVLTDQVTSQPEEEIPSSSVSGRLIKKARGIKQDFTERSQEGWSKKEIISYYLDRVKQLVQAQSNLHGRKRDFARLKAKFQALMSKRR